MRHRKAGRKFGRNSASRKAMFRNMVTSLLRHEQIRTTEAKAKELRGYAEKVISLGKRAPSRPTSSRCRVRSVRPRRLRVSTPSGGRACGSTMVR